MEDKLKIWSEQIVPWLTTHGVKILLIAVVAFVLDKVLSKIIIRTVRATVKPENNATPEAEKKREDTLIRIFNGAIHVLLVVIASIMILDEIGINVGTLIAGAGILGLAVGFGGQYLIKDIIT